MIYLYVILRIICIFLKLGTIPSVWQKPHLFIVKKTQKKNIKNIILNMNKHEDDEM